MGSPPLPQAGLQAEAPALWLLEGLPAELAEASLLQPEAQLASLEPEPVVEQLALAPRASGVEALRPQAGAASEE